MIKITADYVESLAPVYRDVLNAFWVYDSTLSREIGVALRTIHAIVADRWSVGAVQAACKELVRHKVLQVDRAGMYRPTKMGEELIAAVIGEAPEVVPPFSPPPG